MMELATWVTFWVKGEYVDDDENGLWDVCEQVGIRVTEKPGSNRNMGYWRLRVRWRLLFRSALRL